MRGKRYRWLLVLAIVASIMIGIVARLENWKRDLTTNHARLDANASDPLLRPLVVPTSPEQLADRVQQSVSKLSRWSLESREQLAEGMQLHFTRRTRLFRFVDDIYVRLSRVEGGTRLDAESRSRVGKGDLGQNPRNLRELTQELSQGLASELAAADD